MATLSQYEPLFGSSYHSSRLSLSITRPRTLTLHEPNSPGHDTSHSSEENQTQDSHSWFVFTLLFLVGCFTSNPFLGSPLLKRLFQTLFKDTSLPLLSFYHMATYLAALPITFLLYFLVRHHTFKTVLILVSILTAAGNFSFILAFKLPVLIYTPALLNTASWVLFAFLPQRVAGLWFYREHRFRVCSLLYCTRSISGRLEENLLLLLDIPDDSFQKQLLFYFFCKGMLILLLVCIVALCLKQPTQYPSPHAARILSPLKDACCKADRMPHFKSITFQSSAFIFLIQTQADYNSPPKSIIYSSILLIAAVLGGGILAVLSVPIQRNMPCFYKTVSFFLISLIYLQLLFQHHSIPYYLFAALNPLMYYFFYASCFELLFQILHPTNTMQVALLEFLFIALTCLLVQGYKLLSLTFEWSFSIYVLLTLVLIWSLLNLKPLYVYPI